MATDFYGNDVSVGDTVTKVGYSGEFIITAESPNIWGDPELTIQGSWEERNVSPDQVIKRG